MGIFDFLTPLTNFFTSLTSLASVLSAIGYLLLGVAAIIISGALAGPVAALLRLLVEALEFVFDLTIYPIKNVVEYLLEKNPQFRPSEAVHETLPIVDPSVSNTRRRRR